MIGTLERVTKRQSPESGSGITGWNVSDGCTSWRGPNPKPKLTLATRLISCASGLSFCWARSSRDRSVSWALAGAAQAAARARPHTARASALLITSLTSEHDFEQLLQQLLQRHDGEEERNHRQEGDHRELEHRGPREWHNAHAPDELEAIAQVRERLDVRAPDQRLARRGAAAGSDVFPLPRPLNTALLGVQAIERALLRLGPLPFGSSVVLVARKAAA